MLMTLLNDPKPTAARQCLSAVREIVVFRPELCPRIRSAIGQTDLSRYKASMRPLIRKDMDEVLERMDG